MLGILLACILGLLLGGILGAVATVLLYEMRSGRINVPPKIGLGPIHIDTSALAKPSDRRVDAAADFSDVAPVVDSGGSVAAGCLTLISAGLVLLGFVLPWFTCNLANLIQGSFSGVTQLFTMVLTLLTTIFGGLFAQSSGDRAASGALALVIVVATLLLAVVPLAGLYIGSVGLKVMKSLRESREERNRLSRLLIRAGILGLIPVCLYITAASAIPTVNLTQGLPGVPRVAVQSTGPGLWVTVAGFVVAIAAGFVISVTASLAEQMIGPPSTPDEIETPDVHGGEGALQ
ncbi:MAG: hypothetical protein PVG71_06390 [Anaerolineae bacterium]|jgi:hypothetical protein